MIELDPVGVGWRGWFPRVCYFDTIFWGSSARRPLPWSRTVFFLVSLFHDPSSRLSKTYCKPMKMSQVALHIHTQPKISKARTHTSERGRGRAINHTIDSSSIGGGGGWACSNFKADGWQARRQRALIGARGRHARVAPSRIWPCDCGRAVRTK
jgi:hypothetical protein